MPLNRFYAQFLGLTALLSRPNHSPTLTAISIDPFARKKLLNLLDLKGAPQWGIVLGEVQGERLHIQYVLPAGQRHPASFPFMTWNTPYLCGAAEVLTPLYNAETDWYGIWAIQPDCQLPTVAADMTLAENAQRQGLMDDQQPLLSIGWQDGILTVQAYKYVDEVTLVSLPVSL